MPDRRRVAADLPHPPAQARYPARASARLHCTHGRNSPPGTELLVLRDLMGHASYVRPSATTLAEEYAASRSRLKS